MNPGLRELKPYPFERLAALRARVPAAGGLPLIDLSIGEPQHPTPPAIGAALVAALAGTARYPATRGLPELRAAIAAWAGRRHGLPDAMLDAERQVLPVNGTREALFAIAQCVVAAGGARDLVVMPNPFYQIYEGAALLAGARPWYLPARSERDGRPDFAAVPSSVWDRAALVYVCSPGNPSGEILDDADYALLTNLADRHGFVIVADECYSELYPDEERPPAGLLGWCARHGRSGLEHCVVVNSLSKRSNAPGLRSGFAIGEATLMGEFFRYRTYQGGAMPIHVQHASIAAWNDETHVRANRALYRAKYAAVLPLLSGVWDVAQPAGGFYLWPRVGGDDVALCERLLGQAGVLCLPGSYLGRDAGSGNPGAGRLRLALVADLDACVEAARRIRALIEHHRES